MFTPRSAPDGPPPITQRPQTGGGRRYRRGRQSVQTSRRPRAHAVVLSYLPGVPAVRSPPASGTAARPQELQKQDGIGASCRPFYGVAMSAVRSAFIRLDGSAARRVLTGARRRGKNLRPAHANKGQRKQRARGPPLARIPAPPEKEQEKTR
jgi:hypothetical protein